MSKLIKTKLSEVLWELIESESLLQLEVPEIVNIAKRGDNYYTFEVVGEIIKPIITSKEDVVSKVEAFLESQNEEELKKEYEYYQMLNETYNEQDVIQNIAN